MKTLRNSWSHHLYGTRPPNSAPITPGPSAPPSSLRSPPRTYRVSRLGLPDQHRVTATYYNNNRTGASLSLSAYGQSQSRNMSTTPARALNYNNINPHVKRAQYAVRGELAVKSEEYRARLAKGDKTLPFDQIISANIGNPQQLDQKPITFFRQVLSILENPKLLEHEDVLLNTLGYKTDVIERAKWLLSKVGSVGAYSASNGVPAIKQSVADFLESELSTVSPAYYDPTG